MARYLNSKYMTEVVSHNISMNIANPQKKGLCGQAELQHLEI